LAPFAERYGNKIGKFDFQLAGVTSISSDNHKYGLAPKGVSVVLFKNAGYRTHAMFSATSWPGGIYVTPGIAGSRGGVASVGAWIALCYYGYEGFKVKAEEIFKAQERFMGKLREMKEVKIIGEPKLGTVAIVSNKEGLNIYSVHDLLIKKGWHVSAMQRPASIQFLLNYCNLRFLDGLIRDLGESVARCASDPGLNGDNKWMRIYASCAKMPSSLVDEGAKLAVESFLKI